jgi:hypothetical protein
MKIYYLTGTTIYYYINHLTFYLFLCRKIAFYNTPDIKITYYN